MTHEKGKEASLAVALKGEGGGEEMEKVVWRQDGCSVSRCNIVQVTMVGICSRPWGGGGAKNSGLRPGPYAARERDLRHDTISPLV